MRRLEFQALALCITAIFSATRACAATLALGSAATGADGSITVPIEFRPEGAERISGLQFEITFDAKAAAFQSLTAGASATTTAKMLSFNALQPGRYRVIIAGFNQNLVPAGPVALLTLTLSTPGLALGLESPIMSDPDGRAVAAKATGGAVGSPGAEAPPPPSARPACGCDGGNSPAHTRADAIVLVVTAATLALARYTRNLGKRYRDRHVALDSLMPPMGAGGR
jgi:hypothetical protein